MGDYQRSINDTVEVVDSRSPGRRRIQRIDELVPGMGAAFIAMDAEEVTIRRIDGSVVTITVTSCAVPPSDSGD